MVVFWKYILQPSLKIFLNQGVFLENFFYKIFTKKSPLYLFDLIPSLNRAHDTRHSKNITSINATDPLEDSFSCFCLFIYLCLYFVKIDNITKIGNDFTIYLSYYIFSAVSMRTQNSIFPKNDHFNFKLYISTSMCWIYFLIIYLCLLHKMVSHFFEVSEGHIFIAIKVHLSFKYTKNSP